MELLEYNSEMIRRVLIIGACFAFLTGLLVLSLGKHVIIYVHPLGLLKMHSGRIEYKKPSKIALTPKGWTVWTRRSGFSASETYSFGNDGRRYSIKAYPEFSDVRWPPTYSSVSGQIGIPFWIPLLVSAVLFWITLISPIRQRQKRRTSGKCEHCGYNLTGNTTGHCPECAGAY